MYKKSAGFSLIEVLISLLIFSLVLLGWDALGIYSYKTSRDAYFFSVALNQLEEMSERLYALKQFDGLSEQIILWNQHNQEILPQGSGEVAGVYPYYLITLHWGDNFECGKDDFLKINCISTSLDFL
jgi:prepilin-type N-terminal cleavage/methylation domain-containing protein